MAIDVERLNQVAQNVFRRFSHQIDGQPRAFAEYNERRYAYETFVMRFIDDWQWNQFLMEQAFMSALDAFFEQNGAIASPDNPLPQHHDLLVWRRRLEFTPISLVIDPESRSFAELAEVSSINIVSATMRCHTMRVVDAIPNGISQSGNIALQNTDPSAETNRRASDHVFSSRAMQGRPAVQPPTVAELETLLASVDPSNAQDGEARVGRIERRSEDRRADQPASTRTMGTGLVSNPVPGEDIARARDADT